MASAIPALTHQGHLVDQLHVIFPNDKIHVNTKRQSFLKYPSTGAYLELDAWIPTLNLSFEFQDHYHYTTTWYAHRTLENIQHQDDIKKEVLHNKGMSLVVVPCWWDGTAESLAATIKFQRPDLEISLRAAAISINPPLGFFKSHLLPDIESLMPASFPQDPKFTDTIEASDWWIGEKYDGVRFCWNPKRQTAYSRNGKQILLPTSFEWNIPLWFLDGEFWFGRGLFSFSFLMFKDLPEIVSWHILRMVCFDVPSKQFQDRPFEVRYNNILAHIPDESPTCVLAPRILGQSNEHLHVIIAAIISGGGEGAILRKRGTFYERGRTNSLIKLKTTYGDKEGLVVGTTRAGVTLKLPNGNLFLVPISSVRIPLPNKGDVVTFSYEVHSRRDLPVNPEITRKRLDISWEEVLENAQNEKKTLNDVSNFTAKPRGYWTIENMRSFFIQLARDFKLDPFLASTWYTIPFDAIYALKSGRTIMHKFNGHFAALQALFPNIGLDDRTAVEQSSWNDKTKRRKFFENIAKEHNFDPLIAENWYPFPRSKIMSYKGANRIILYHKQSVARALQDLFPTVHIDRNKFWFSTQWRDARRRRRFFENFAAENGFDPRNPEGWYAQSRRAIVNFKGAREVLSHYKENVSKGLLDVFPDIGLDKSKLWIRIPSSTSPRVHKGRRLFFEKFAALHGFDPLVAKNWYSQNRLVLLSQKGMHTVLAYHQNSVVNALCDLFPEIGLQKAKFKAQFTWHEEETRRKFFERYAAANDFDPLNAEFWYLQPRKRLISFKGATSVISYHKNSMITALLDLFPNIGLDRSRFFHMPNWSKEETRRKFFQNYAKAHAFDPLNPEVWYLQPKSQIMDAKGAVKVAHHHGKSIARALTELFPNIGIKKTVLFKKWGKWNV